VLPSPRTAFLPRGSWLGRQLAPIAGIPTEARRRLATVAQHPPVSNPCTLARSCARRLLLWHTSFVSSMHRVPRTRPAHRPELRRPVQTVHAGLARGPRGWLPRAAPLLVQW